MMYRSSHAVLIVFLFSMAAPALADKVANPTYKQWASFKPGAWVKTSQVTEADGAKTEIVLTTTLVSVTPEKVTVETKATITAGGVPATLDPVRQDHPAWIDDPSGPVVDPSGVTVPQPKEGAESITVNGKRYACKTSEYTLRIEQDIVRNKSWISDEVPGGIVKTESRVTAPGQSSLTTMTLVEYAAKKEEGKGEGGSPKPEIRNPNQ